MNEEQYEAMQELENEIRLLFDDSLVLLKEARYSLWNNGDRENRRKIEKVKEKIEELKKILGY